MSEKYNSSVFNWDEDIVKSIKDAKFSQAEIQQIHNENDFIDFFKKSGFEAIWTLIRKSTLLPYMDSVLITYTTLISSIEKQRLSDFVLCHSKHDSEFIGNVKLYYKPLYKYLQSEKLGVFYKNQFFKNPSNSNFYISSSDDLFFDNIKDKDGNVKGKESLMNDLIEIIKTSHESDKAFFEMDEKNLCSDKSKSKDTGKFSLANCSIMFDYFKSIDSFKKNESSDDVIQYHNLLHYCFEKLYHNKGENLNSKTYLISIPIIGAIGGEKLDDFEGQGACFLFFECNEDLLNSDTLGNLIRNISYLLKDITYNYLFESGIHLYENVIKKSVESAVGAIMARNLSHNIGSHVISALTTQDELFNTIHTTTFIKYIQQRMDFIAQITTEWPNWTYPAWFLRDMVRRLYMQTYLLEYIASSDGYNAYHYQPEKNSGPKVKISVINNLGESIITNDENDTLNDKDVQVAIPGGVIGIQAFYTILENLIRNSAKHTKNNSKGNNLEISIQFIDNEKDCVEFFVYDEFADSVDLQNSIQNKITNSFIDNTGNLLKENWGIAEMKISAGFLKKISISRLSQSHDPEINPILYDVKTSKGLINFVKKKINGKEKYGYYFCIPKPKELLILIEDNTFFQNNRELIIRAKKFNIYFETEMPKYPDYDFVILDETWQNKILDGICNIETLPYRLFVKDLKTKDDFYLKRLAVLNNECKRLYNELATCNNEIDFEDLKLKLYSNWVEHIINCNDESTKQFDLFIQTVDEKNQQFNPKNGSNFGIGYEEDIETLPKIFRSPNIQLEPEVELQHADNKENGDKTLELLEKGSVNSLPDITKLPPFLKKIDIKTIIKPKKILIKDSLPELNKTSIVLKRHCAFQKSRYYMEALSGSQMYFSLLDSGHTDYNSNKILLQILENAFTKILIIDERIAKYYYELKNSVKPSDNEQRLKLLLGHTYIPHYMKLKNTDSYFDIIGKREIPDNLYESDERVKTDTKTTVKKELVTLDFNKLRENYSILLIHQGILDKLVDLYESKNNIQILIKEFKENIPFVIVTSGRGQTSEVAANEKFLAYSNLNEYLLKDYPEKFILLTQIITKILAL